MTTLIYLLCFLGAISIVKIYNLHTAKPVRNKSFWLVVLVLTSFLLWGGEKPSPDPDPPPPPPEEPDEPDEPIVENVRLKLIGRVNEEGNFVPLTSEWVQITTTNGVIEVQQIEELINE